MKTTGAAMMKKATGKELKTIGVNLLNRGSFI